MRILSLDISTSSGWAYYDEAVLAGYGAITLPKTIREYGPPYPWNYCDATEDMAHLLYCKVEELDPDIVVVEETNRAKARFSQKILEYIHKGFLVRMKGRAKTQVIYLSSSTWRKTLGLVMSKEDKRNNTRLSAAKRKSAEWGVKLDKSKLGIKGKVNKKHIAIRYVNATHGLHLKAKDDDVADAICLVDAFLKGAVPCDGIK